MSSGRGLLVASASAIPTIVALVDRAAATLAGAQSAAQVLDARDIATAAYDQAKRAARLAAARSAHDDIVARIHRAQAGALEIEAAAKRRLADEYDAAQERGEAQKAGGDRTSNVPKQNNAPKVTDLGLSRKQIHEAREIRDAEKIEPGIVHRVVTEAVDAGEEPTKAKVRKAVKAKSKRKRQPRKPSAPPEGNQHDRDLKMLISIWEAACPSAQQAFRQFLEQEKV